MSILKFNFTEVTDIGLVRKANEDNLGNALTPNGHVFTVCDGMGGHVGGATASALAVKSILEYFSRERYDNIYIAIANAINFANEQIYAHAQNNAELKGMGTTCTVAVISDKELYIGHVGDSRIYLRTAGKLRRVTRDHSFVQTLVNQGIISDSEAEQHPRKNELLMAMGIKPAVQPTVSTYPIKPCTGDVIMLCSDGLCGLVNDMTMDSIIVKADSLNDAANALINAAKNAGGHDNISVQIIQFTDSPYTHAEYEDLSPQELIDTGNKGFNPLQTMHANSVKKNKVLTGRKKFILLGLFGVVAAIIAVLLINQPIPTKKNQQEHPQSELIQKQEDKIGYDTIEVKEKDNMTIKKFKKERKLNNNDTIEVKLPDAKEYLKPGPGSGYPKEQDTLKSGTLLRWKKRTEHLTGTPAASSKKNDKSASSKDDKKLTKDSLKDHKDTLQ